MLRENKDLFSHFTFRQVFNDFDESQETIILKHKQVGGEEIPDHKQQEPLSMIRQIIIQIKTFLELKF